MSFIDWLKGLFTSKSPAAQPSVDKPVESVDIPLKSVVITPIKATGVLKGIDLSHWETVESWSTLAKQDIQFGYTKMSEGKTFGDPARKTITAGFNSIKLPAGGYHVIHCEQDIAAQVAWYKKSIEGLDLQCRHMIDYETGVNKTVPKAQRRQACLEMAKAFAKEFGHKPYLYFNSSDEKEFSFTAEEQTWFDVWLANYNAKELPQTKTIKHVSIWQHTDKLNVPGVGPCDHGYLYDSLESMMMKPGQVATKPVEIPPSAFASGYGTKLDALGIMCGCPKLVARMATFMGVHTPRYVTVFDISKKATEKRFHLLDTHDMVVMSITCGVGSGSDPDNDGYATKFSDDTGSHMTSLGVFRYAERSKMSDGRPCVRLDGLEASNAHMRSRAILLHPATYVTDERAGRSSGCEAIAYTHLDWLDKLKDGSFGIIG